MNRNGLRYQQELCLDYLSSEDQKVYLYLLKFQPRKSLCKEVPVFYQSQSAYDLHVKKMTVGCLYISAHSLFDKPNIIKKML